MIEVQNNNQIKDESGNRSKPLFAVVLFLSWLKTLIWFYVFRKFRNWNYEQISFIEKYKKRLEILKENRAQTVDTNTDCENAVYDDAINKVAEFIRDLKSLT